MTDCPTCGRRMRIKDHERNSMGGKARAAKLSPERRREIARIAAAKRWAK